jgi:hypothetical protein
LGFKAPINHMGSAAKTMIQPASPRRGCPKPGCTVATSTPNENIDATTKTVVQVMSNHYHALFCQQTWGRLNGVHMIYIYTYNLYLHTYIYIYVYMAATR